MTKTKTYRYGTVTCKAVMCTAGNGWEVVFKFNHKPIFVGNFIHSQEALRWWAFMNREVTHFGKKYTAGYKYPSTWLSHFLGNHLYQQYYVFLEKLFVSHHRDYQKAFAKNCRQYKTLKGNKSYWMGRKTPVLKVA